MALNVMGIRMDRSGLLREQGLRAIRERRRHVTKLTQLDRLYGQFYQPDASTHWDWMST